GREAPAAAATPAAPAPVAQVAALVGDPAERETRIETNDVIAVFTNRGARLKSWRLKRYEDPNHHPLELVATDLATTQPLPFSVRTADERITAELNAALYQTRESGTSVTFEFRDAAGLQAAKTFMLGPTP